jgi:hypothetical protein
MFKLHVVQARFGDCLILEYGTKGKPRYTLVDGGPPGNFAEDLEPALGAIVGSDGKLDLAVVSHVDNDHIIGILDLFAALEDDDVSERPRRVGIGGLWHNSFARSIDPTGDVSQRMLALMVMASAANVAMPLASDAFFALREGGQLRLLARKLKIPANQGFKDDLIVVEPARKAIKLGPLALTIAGPSKANLKALREEWLDWLTKAADKMAFDPAAAAMSDGSIPNLSSIVILATCSGKTVLLTGDARGDHIIGGLAAAKLAKRGKLYVDVLKVQHHGSGRNANRAFFDAVAAKTYVLSANGRNGNPDFDTLRWIVESARDRGQPIKLVVTNETETTRELQKKLKASAYGYELTTIPAGEHSLTLTLSD